MSLSVDGNDRDASSDSSPQRSYDSSMNPVASAAQVARTPSRDDGIPEQLERDLRAFGAILIQQAGVLLKLPQVVMATGCTLFQRFWFVTSLRHFGVRDIALSSLFLASKLEEISPPPRLRDLINVLDYLVKRVDHERGLIAVETAKSLAAKATGSNGSETTPAPASALMKYEPMDYFAKGFYDMKEETVIGEMQLLKRLGFNLTLQHPYGALANYLQVLGLTDHPVIPQRAWNFCNDALLTPLLAMYPSTYIAVAAIYLATALPPVSLALPMEPRPWWMLFDVSSEAELHAVCTPLLEVYESWGEGAAGLMDASPSSNATTLWRRAATKSLPMTKTAVRDWLDHHSTA